ncbi:hypothetical protein M378DRAFT_174454, partial [Amanita muscaria Koide BX008]
MQPPWSPQLGRLLVSTAIICSVAFLNLVLLPPTPTGSAPATLDYILLPWEQSIVQALYRWVWKNLFISIAAASVTIGLILLAKKYLLPPSLPSSRLSPLAQYNQPLYYSTLLVLQLLKLYQHFLLSSLPSSRLSPQASTQRDQPSDPTVLTPEQYRLLESPLTGLTQHDLPSDPNLYKAYLCRVFSIKSADVIDFTGLVDRTRFIAAGGSGEVWEASWKGLDNRALPMVAVKLVRLPPLRDEVHKDKRFKTIKRELLVWSKLDHSHILPLIGTARIEGDANLPAVISPWMKNGNVMEFLKQNLSFPASRFLKNIIKGLHYLHIKNKVTSQSHHSRKIVT